METIKKITFEEIKNLLPKLTNLYYVHYDENLDEQTEIIQKCINNKNADSLYEKIDDWYIGSSLYAIEEYNKELLNDICRTFEIEEEEAKEIIETYQDEITDHYYCVDNSNVVKDLAKNSQGISIRIPLYSNYDCINSHHFEGGYAYKESYFGHMVDVLNLNPAKVKNLLKEKEVETFGAFPNYKNRNGKELVSYEDFWQELQNSCCGANLLVFVAKIDITDLIENNFEIKEIIIPKGNNCGLFSDIYGGGSIIGMELKSDFKIKLNTPRKKNLTKYDSFGLLIDEENGYSINHVYGVTNSFWGNEISIIN